MKVTVVGCSGSFPGPDSAASCYLVQAQHEGRTWNLVLDLGPGSLGQLQRYIGLEDIDAVFLSHLHPDHCLDLTGLFVVQKYNPARTRDARRIPVLGPHDTAARMSRATSGWRAISVRERLLGSTTVKGSVVEVHVSHWLTGTLKSSFCILFAGETRYKVRGKMRGLP